MNKLSFQFPGILTPERVFVVLSSVCGALFLLLTPPFQVPDEANHFYRAYQLSEGNFIPVMQDNRVGGYVPESVIKITHPFLDLPWNGYKKINYKIIAERLKIPLNAKEKRFTDFPNTAIYVLPYLPQAAVIFILREFNLPPLYIFYGTRFFMLICWIASMFYAIKMIPFHKWLMTLIALLPMSLFVNMSLSADVVTNAVSFILISYILKLAYVEDRIAVRNFLRVCFLLMLLASAKIVYVPLIVLLLLIPKKKFHSKKAYFVQFFVLGAIAFSTAFFWSEITKETYLPYSAYNEHYRDSTAMVGGADIQGQMQYVFHHGLYLCNVFIHSLKTTFDMYFEGYIGTLGWLDVKFPLWFIYLSYAVILIVAILDGNRTIELKTRHRIILFISMTAMICLILLSQLLTWTAVGGDLIRNLQGRYFIPVFPLLFMLFYSSKFNRHGIIIIPVVIGFSLYSSFLAAKTLYVRYYFTPKYASVTIKCDAEHIAKGNFFETSQPSVYFQSDNSQSGEKARSGTYSAKLTRHNPFGFTYWIKDARAHDLITAEVWRYGKGGELIVQGGGNGFYANNSIVVEKENTGWEKLQINCIVPKNMNDDAVGVYIYYSSDDSAYFDDMEIVYNKVVTEKESKK